MSKKVLIVDDSSVILVQLTGILEKAGYEVIEAQDGLQGMNKLKDNPEVRLVISDVYMPVMDGIEMVQKIKNDTSYSELPIIMLTTEGSPKQIARAKEAGAKGWFVKPFNGNDLLAAVDLLTS